MRKIKFIDSNSYSRGGAVKSMLNLATWLNQGGTFNASIISPEIGYLKSSPEHRNLLIEESGPLDVGRNSEQNKLSKTLLIIKYWISFSGKCDFSNSYICVNEPKSVLLYFPYILRNRKRAVYYLRINEKIKFINTLILILFPRVLLISSCGTKAFNSFFLNIYKYKVKVLNTGFDIDDAMGLKISNQETQKSCKLLRLCYVASLCERKNQKFLIDCMSKITELYPSVTLHLFGESPLGHENYKSELNKLIKDYGLENNIFFEGHINNPIKEMREFDIFLMASLLEGLPRVVIEALLSGLYVVTVPTDGVMDIIKDEYTGVITSEYDRNEFSNHVMEKLSFLTHSYDDELELKKSRIEYAKNKFSKLKFVNGFEKIIKGL